MSSAAGMERIRTFMSPVYFRSPGSPATAPAVGSDDLIPLPSDSGSGQLCVLDDLLGGGIAIPPDVLRSASLTDPTARAPGLLVVITGRPGSGKSTFAFELCYRLATNANGEMPLADRGLTSIYFSAEANTHDLVAQASGLGWDQPPVGGSPGGKAILPYPSAPGLLEHPAVLVFGRDRLPNAAASKPEDYFAEVGKRWSSFLTSGAHPPRVVVFDSLNILPSSWKTDDVMQQLVASCLRGPLIVVALLDSHWTSESADRWSHLSDITIDLAYDQREDYMVRELQIVKARYQDHADGKHRLKINPKPSTNDYVRHPMSPLIKEGGVFVFQSIHRALSRARRRSRGGAPRLAAVNPLPTPFGTLNEIVHTGGLPSGACTAVVGSRGGMKSHLAYYTMLKFLEDNANERALLISLRDEEAAARETLAAIYERQLNQIGMPWAANADKNAARARVAQLLDKDRLEVLFFWPGYISPEEFLHLVRVAVDRCPKESRPVSLVVVNGLEQLSARFPLCAKEKMFVSGLVTMLTVCGATSLVVSGGDPSKGSDQGGVPEGLLQMADLILESSFQLLPRRQVWSDEVWAGNSWSDSQRLDVLRAKQFQRDPLQSELEPHVVYQVVREPGARECRRRALFYMGRKSDPAPLQAGSVEVRLLPDEFPYGERL